MQFLTAEFIAGLTDK